MAEARGAPPRLGGKSRWLSSLVQQRTRVWQPIFTPLYTVPFFLLCGILFLGTGFLLSAIVSGVTEVKVDYTDVASANSAGSFNLTVTETMVPPIWVYYELSKYFQNHRRYVKGFSGMQLKHADSPDKFEQIRGEVLSNCEPEQVRHRGDRTLYPCGMVPLSVFSDTLVIFRETEAGWKRVLMDSNSDTIAWPVDANSGKFRNLDPEGIDPTTGKMNQVAFDMWILKSFPPVECEQVVFNAADAYEPVLVATRMEKVIHDDGTVEEIEVVDCTNYMTEPSCNFTRKGQPFKCEANKYYRQVKTKSWGVESGHLMVWMRIAGLPTFSKLLGKIDETLEKGTYKVSFENRLPSRTFTSRKSLVLSTSSEWGGHGDNLGVSCMVVGGSCLIFGLWQCLLCLYCPRPLGDVSRLFQ